MKARACSGLRPSAVAWAIHSGIAEPGFWAGIGSVSVAELELELEVPVVRLVAMNVPSTLAGRYRLRP